MDEIVVGLDLGTSKACCVIGALDEHGKFHVAGFGSCASEGLRNGVIISIRAAMKSVQTAVEMAEAKGFEVREMAVALSGGTIEGTNSRGVVGVSANSEIGPADMARVLDAAKAVVIPLDREILHVLPQEYIVDDVKNIRNPLEMIGIRLEAEVHIITGSIAAARNLVHCVNNAGFAVTEVMLESLASAAAVLSKEEKEVGVLLIDIGAGTTDAVLFKDGAPHFTRVYSLGSHLVTRDLAHVLQVPDEEAEQIKVRDGHAFLEALDDNREVIIRGVGSREAYATERSRICEIIQPRMEEILGMIAKDLSRTGLLQQLGGGVVLTGGGAKLEGLTELAQEIFGAPARLGRPMRIAGLEDKQLAPEYAAALGLVLSSREHLTAPVAGDGPVRKKSGKPAEGLGSRIKDWFKRNFI